MIQNIITYNVNGIRAAMTKGLIDWLADYAPDIVCLQEIKANEDQIDIAQFEKLGYHHYWHSAQKKGYSGVAILSKTKPLHITYGCGIEKYDFEGRVIIAHYEKFILVNTYFPSGSSGEERQQVKMKFLNDYLPFIEKLKKQNQHIIIAGDYNICHKAIDIHDPISNKESSGFLPEERAWMDKFFEQGFCDSFRKMNQSPQQYSWWSFRANARNNNKGWRIDYINTTDNLTSYYKSAEILPLIKHSDHCPVMLSLEW
jgi:exodeoxyribonuclease-3